MGGRGERDGEINEGSRVEKSEIGSEGEARRKARECSLLMKQFQNWGHTTNLHGVKCNYYYPHFRNDGGEADVLGG